MKSDPTRYSPIQWGMIGLLVFALCACSNPSEQSFDPNAAAPTLHVKNASELSLLPGDSSRLPLKSWLPKSEPKAILIGLHGFNDYSHAFSRPAKYLNEKGIAVYAFDQRGFGGNTNLGIWGGEKNLTSDLTDMVIAVKKRHPGKPVYVMGESMGGAVAISASTRPDFPKIDGLILAAPAVWGDDTMNGFYRATLWVLAHTIPSEPITGQDLKILASDNIPMLREMGADPLVLKKTRFDAVYGIVRLMDSAYDKVPQIKTPVLMLYGAKDQVIPPAPIKSASSHIKADHKFAYYPLGYHMLLRDLNANLVLGDIVSWINAPHAPLPSGYENTAKEFINGKRLHEVQTASTVRPTVRSKE